MGILAWQGGAVVLSPMLEFSVPIIFGYLVCQDVLRMSGYDALNTPFRTADLVAIHLCSLVDVMAMVFLLECLSSSIFSHPLASRRTLTISKNAWGCIAFGWAESHGDISYTIFLIVINVGCLRLSSSHQYTQMIRCIQCHIWWMKLMKLKFCPCSAKASFRCCTLWPWEGAPEGSWGLWHVEISCNMQDAT